MAQRINHHVEPGVLYVVATPIGNLEDITLRAIRVLSQCDEVLAEDTRVTRKLLSHLGISTPLHTFNQHTRSDACATVIQRLKAGRSIALVTDAGTPTVSDPGAELVRLAVHDAVVVVPVPGPTAVATALVAAALPSARFTFEGFPPRTTSARRTFFEALQGERRTMVLYEAPSRLLSTLRALANTLGERDVAVARELTKLHEEVFRGSLGQAVAHFTHHTPRGEFTLVVAGFTGDEREPHAVAGERLVRSLLASGVSVRNAAAAATAALKIPRKEAYALCLLLANGNSGGAEQPEVKSTAI